MKDFIIKEGGPKPTMVWGEELLFDLNASRDLLGYCEINDAAVLGIEGFRVVGSRRIPDMNYIADFSSLSYSDQFPALSRKSAQRFIESIIDSEILLEFMLVTV